MATLGSQVWVVLAVIAGAGVLGVLHYLTASLSNATYLHDMKVRVAALRKDQAERLQALAEAADAGQAPAPQPLRKAA